MSCSLDKCVKMFLKTGDQCANLNIVKFDNNQKQWKFPYDWIELKLKEMDTVFKSQRAIENEEFTENEMNIIKTQFLVNSYFDLEGKMMTELKNQLQTEETVVKKEDNKKNQLKVNKKKDV